MKIKIGSFFVLITIVGQIVLAQDSAMQAAPGSGPPPQGWTAELPPESGIHAPVKKPKKMKLQLKNADDKTTPKITASPSP